MQFLIILRIARNVIAKFILPKFTVAFGRDEPSAALVCMPKAAVDKDYRLILRQNNIRLTRELRYIFAVPKPLAK
jgi:hypothetical protein